MKVETNRALTYKIICVAVKQHSHALGVGARLDQALSMNEHLSEPVADLLTLMVTEYDHSQVADEMLRSIAGKSFNAQETKTPRSIAKFLVSFAERCPDIVLKKMSLLLTHLDSEVRRLFLFSLKLTIPQSYPLRQAMVEIMGFIIKDLEGKIRTVTTSTSEDSNLDSKSMQKQIIGLYDLLRERTGDLNTYVRARVYQVFSRLLDLELKFPKQRLAITTSAISALEDKAATVRKAAISLLTKLMVTHPFGIHGGHLELSEWQVKYDEIVKELRAIEKNINQVMGTTDEGEEDKTQETEPG
jgi:condensin complex subunit 1